MSTTLQPSGDNKLVPIQIAEYGVFKGHVSGPFEISAQTFKEIVRNFTDGKLPVPIDAEHASEQDASSGSIPVSGAPAFGWIHSLEDRGIGGLWGMVEWLEPAKTYIKEGRYRYLSPAIRFGAKDRVTGKPIGAVLSSAAIVNTPFLRTMAPLAAKDAGALDVLVRMSDSEADAWRATVPANAEPRLGLDRHVHSPHEYMPAIKLALKLPELATAHECSEYLDRLRERCEASGPEGKYQGVNLSEYTQPLRKLVDAQHGATWEDVFDTVDDLVETAIEESEPSAAEHVSESANLRNDGGDQRALANNVEENNMATDDKVLLKDLETKAATLTTEVATLTAEKTALATEKVSLTTEKATLTLRVKELEGDLKTKGDELVKLREDSDKRAEADLLARRDEAFDTYKDKKHLTEADKETMLIVAKADMAKFDLAYPRIAADQRHLLRAATPAANRQTTEQLNAGALSLRERTFKIMKEQKVSFDEAQLIATQKVA